MSGEFKIGDRVMRIGGDTSSDGGMKWHNAPGTVLHIIGTEVGVRWDDYNKYFTYDDAPEDLDYHYEASRTLELVITDEEVEAAVSSILKRVR